MLAQVKIIDENISPNLAILENQSKTNLKHLLTCCRWLCQCFGEFFLEKQGICDKIFLLKNIFHKMAKICTLKKITIPTSKQSIFNRI
jgi:hypothetical protein